MGLGIDFSVLSRLCRVVSTLPCCLDVSVSVSTFPCQSRLVRFNLVSSSRACIFGRIAFSVICDASGIELDSWTPTMTPVLHSSGERGPTPATSLPKDLSLLLRLA